MNPFMRPVQTSLQDRGVSWNCIIYFIYLDTQRLHITTIYSGYSAEVKDEVAGRDKKKSIVECGIFAVGMPCSSLK